MPPLPPSLRRFFTPPPRQATLLPDSHFFARTLAVASDADAAAVAEQVELALESLAPFPLPQLYYGHLWQPGSPHALVYAAYRKRFLPEETEAWADAELVIPALAVAASAPAAGETVRVLSDDATVTALYWDGPSLLPAGICIRAFGPEATDDTRAHVRAAALAAFPPTATIEDWPTPAVDPLSPVPGLVFLAGDFRATLAALPPGMDVRDKDELAGRRRAQRRDLMLWRTLQAAAVLVLACGITEIGLVGGRAWLAARNTEIAARAPEVDKVMKADALAGQITRLASQRLLPLEMLNLVREQRPGKTQLLSARMENLYVLQATARTTAVTDIDAFRAALSQQPACERVDIQDTQIRDGVASFTVIVRFKPSAVKPEDARS